MWQFVGFSHLDQFWCWRMALLGSTQPPGWGKLVWANVLLRHTPCRGTSLLLAVEQTTGKKRVTGLSQLVPHWQAEQIYQQPSLKKACAIPTTLPKHQHSPLVPTSTQLRNGCGGNHGHWLIPLSCVQTGRDAWRAGPGLAVEWAEQHPSLWGSTSYPKTWGWVCGSSREHGAAPVGWFPPATELKVSLLGSLHPLAGGTA